MSFCELKGQDKLLSRLDKTLNGGQIAHAYMVVGPEGCGKKTLARAFAKAVLCKDKGCGTCLSCQRVEHDGHPDFSMMTVLKVDEVRDFLPKTYMKPYEGDLKVFVLCDVQDMTVQAQNALLKTLEDPPSHILFMLLATTLDGILPTVKSRCLLLRVTRIEDAQVADILSGKAPEADIQRVVAPAQGSVGRALALLRDPQFEERHQGAVNAFYKLMDSPPSEILSISESFKKDRQSARETFGIWLSLVRDLLAQKWQGGYHDTLHGNQYSGKALMAFAETLTQGIKALSGNGNVQMVCEGVLLKWMEDKTCDNGHRCTV